MTTAIVCPNAGYANRALIRRVNQLFHDLTQSSFDDEHRSRHRVERAFWNSVAQLIPNPASRPGKEYIAADLGCGTGFVT